MSNSARVRAAFLASISPFSVNPMSAHPKKRLSLLARVARSRLDRDQGSIRLPHHIVSTTSLKDGDTGDSQVLKIKCDRKMPLRGAAAEKVWAHCHADSLRFHPFHKFIGLSTTGVSASRVRSAALLLLVHALAPILSECGTNNIQLCQPPSMNT